MEKELPIVADYSYNPISSFREGNPYAIAFCYTDPKYMHLSEFIVKGGWKNVLKFIRGLHIPVLVFETFWYHGTCRHLTPEFINFDTNSKSGKKPFIFGRNSSISRKTGRRFYRNYEVSFMGETRLNLRKFPRKWLPEYNQMLAEEGS